MDPHLFQDIFHEFALHEAPNIELLAEVCAADSETNSNQTGSSLEHVNHRKRSNSLHQGWPYTHFIEKNGTKVPASPLGPSPRDEQNTCDGAFSGKGPKVLSLRSKVSPSQSSKTSTKAWLSSPAARKAA